VDVSLGRDKRIMDKLSSAKLESGSMLAFIPDKFRLIFVKPWSVWIKQSSFKCIKIKLSAALNTIYLCSNIWDRQQCYQILRCSKVKRRYHTQKKEEKRKIHAVLFGRYIVVNRLVADTAMWEKRTQLSTVLTGAIDTAHYVLAQVSRWGIQRLICLRIYLVYDHLKTHWWILATLIDSLLSVTPLSIHWNAEGNKIFNNLLNQWEPLRDSMKILWFS